MLEKLICSDAGLAALDRRLANAKAKGLSSQSEWHESDKRASCATQWAWITERNACAKGKDVKICVMSTISVVWPTCRFRTAIWVWCQRRSSTAARARRTSRFFYEKPEPPAKVVTVGNRQVVAFATQAAAGGVHYEWRRILGASRGCNHEVVWEHLFPQDDVI